MPDIPLTTDYIRHKIEWEGWPDALEWFANGEVEDQKLAYLIDLGLDYYLNLERVKNDIFAILDREASE